MNKAFGLALSAGLALAACGGGTNTNPTDAATTDGRITIGDGSTTTDAAVCGAVGSTGAHCNGAGTCSTGLTCQQEIAQGFNSAITAPQGIPDTMREGHHYRVLGDGGVDPAMESPINAFTGNLCTKQCDVDATTDSCGSCASCSDVVGQNPLVATFGGTSFLIPQASQMFDNTGLCRQDCEFDQNARGECPSGNTCSLFEGVCIEECTSDTECRAGLAATYEGLFVTAVAPEGDTCNTTTGRCTNVANASAQVGSACEGSNDCPANSICLIGGTCALQGIPADATMDGLCGGGRGIVLGVTERSALCVQGCRTSMDCNPGNACNALTSAVGSFTGFCLGVCAADSECRTGEACQGDSTPMAADTNTGNCAATCANPGMRGTAGGCAADEACVAEDGRTTVGFCRPLGTFCTPNPVVVGMMSTPTHIAASTDCGGGQVCDEFLAAGDPGFNDTELFGDGHCVDACTATSCASGTACVTTGPLAGLCRVACSAGGTADAGAADGGTAAGTCPTGLSCDTTLGYCVEAL